MRAGQMDLMNCLALADVVTIHAGNQNRISHPRNSTQRTMKEPDNHSRTRVDLLRPLIREAYQQARTLDEKNLATVLPGPTSRKDTGLGFTDTAAKASLCRERQHLLFEGKAWT